MKTLRQVAADTGRSYATVLGKARKLGIEGIELNDKDAARLEAALAEARRIRRGGAAPEKQLTAWELFEVNCRKLAASCVELEVEVEVTIKKDKESGAVEATVAYSQQRSGEVKL